MRGLLFMLATAIGISAMGTNVEPYLQQLDHELSMSNVYFAKKEKKIDSLRILMNHARTPQEQFERSRALFLEFSNYSIDSARVYLTQTENYAREAGDSIGLMDMRLRQVWFMFHIGVSVEAFNLLNTQDASQMAPQLRENYYRQSVSLYSKILNNQIDNPHHERYRQKLRESRDSLMKYAPNDWTIVADDMLDRGDCQGAIDLYKKNYSDDCQEPGAGIVFFFMSKVYKQLNDVENQKKYLALSAIADIRSGTREYRSLNDLALILYEEGDIQRAHHYIFKSVEDANDSSSSFRIMEASKLLPIIESAYQHQKNKVSTLLRWLIVVAVLMLLILAIDIFFLIRKNKQLHIMHNKLEDSNRQLTISNSIRREYIVRFINLCQSYLNSMENYRKSLNKTAARRNFDELYEAIKSTRYINEEIGSFYANFDEAFLKIYPTFVEEVNNMLRPEEQIVTPLNDKLTTELRILALLRLGINDSKDIATFLRCSNSTIYNYRTKMRNKAIDRDSFEEKIIYKKEENQA